MSASKSYDWSDLATPVAGIKFTALPSPFFKFPPSAEPVTVPPPPDHPTFAHPFTIPTAVYNGLLSPHVPITLALVYMSLVSFWNSANAKRQYKPWALSRTRLFKLFVILHNVFLAAYSAWTCVGMINALRLTIPSWNGGFKPLETVDVLCKLHGPRGLGSAATYNTTTSAWQMTNRLFHLAADGLGPETTDVGRIWNEGLAFYGWLFYLSKFYEVIDTGIVLLKGKKSSFLQTYHHAGAMLSMWAGIRYMSPPIWMFVLVNSGIHAVMYTFYLLSALRVSVPKWFKQSLTTLQITQFVVGATYAFCHLFIAYQIPVSVPYIYHLGSVASKIVTEAPSSMSSAASTAIATASAGAIPWLKKIALRAAGHEGPAENIPNEHGSPFGIDAIHIAEDTTAREETRYREELQWVNCLDTSGQVFAILLNCLYLLPLTWLFVRFFVRAYMNQMERRRSSTASEKAILARNSFRDATKGVARTLHEAVEEMHKTSEEIGDDDTFTGGDDIKRELKSAVDHAKSTIKAAPEKVKQSAHPEKVKEEVQRDMEKVRKNLHDAAEKVKAAVADTSNSSSAEQIKAKAQNLKDSAAEAVEKAMENVKSAAQSAQDKFSQASNEDTKKDVNSSATKGSKSSGGAKSSNQEKSQQSPNGSGTSADGGTNPQQQTDTGTGIETGERTEVKKQKKKQDRIIDESQPVRDKEL